MLHIACILGEDEIASDILEFVVYITDEIHSKKILFEFIGRVWGDGNTVLHLVSFQGMSKLVRRLLELGANPNKKNSRHYRPVDCADDDETRFMFSLYTAAVSSSSDSHDYHDEPSLAKENDLLKSSLPDVTSDLLKPSASTDDDDIAVEKKSSDHVESHTISSKLPSDSSNENRAISLPQNLDSSLNTNIKEKKTVSFDSSCDILHLCRFGSTQGDYVEAISDLRRLFSNIPNVESLSTPSQNLSPVHLACTYNHPSIVEFLIQEAGLPVNARDAEGWTPMHCACAEGHIDVVKILLRCRAKSLSNASESESNNATTTNNNVSGGLWLYPSGHTTHAPIYD